MFPVGRHCHRSHVTSTKRREQRRGRRYRPSRAPRAPARVVLIIPTTIAAADTRACRVEPGDRLTGRRQVRDDASRQGRDGSAPGLRMLHMAPTYRRVQVSRPSIHLPNTGHVTSARVLVSPSAPSTSSICLHLFTAAIFSD